MGLGVAPGLVHNLFLYGQVPPCRHMSTTLCYLSPGSLLSLVVGSPLWHQEKRWSHCLTQLALGTICRPLGPSPMYKVAGS